MKLWQAGLTAGTLWRFFTAYLQECQQCVCINASISPLVPVTSGVPQGSILGPLLFVIYINDITTTPSFLQPFLFAGDSKFLAHLSSAHDYLAVQQDLLKLSEWKSSSRLDFNLNKIFFIQFTLHSPPIEYQYLLDDASLQHKSTCKDLRVTFSSDLKMAL